MIALATVSLTELLPAEVGAEVRAVATQLRVEPDALVVEMIRGMLALGRGAHRDRPPRSIEVPTLTTIVSEHPPAPRAHKGPTTVREERARRLIALKRSA